MALVSTNELCSTFALILKVWLKIRTHITSCETLVKWTDSINNFATFDNYGDFALPVPKYLIWSIFTRLIDWSNADLSCAGLSGVLIVSVNKNKQALFDQILSSSIYSYILSTSCLYLRVTYGKQTYTEPIKLLCFSRLICICVILKS